MKAFVLNVRLAHLLKQRNIFVAISFLLLCTNLLQVFLLLCKDERLIVVPPDIRQEFWIQKNKVSASYLEEMAVFYADLILENTPNGAAFRRDIVLRHAASSSFGTLKTQLLEDEKRLKKEHLSTSFQPNTIKVTPQKLTVHITGDLICYVGKKRISQSKDTYKMTFTYSRGCLRIETFTLLESKPHAL